MKDVFSDSEDDVEGEARDSSVTKVWLLVCVSFVSKSFFQGSEDREFEEQPVDYKVRVMAVHMNKSNSGLVREAEEAGDQEIVWQQRRGWGK